MSKTVRLWVGALPIVVGLLIATAALPDPIKYALAPVIRNLASGLFLTAGVLRMAAWRLTRDWDCARAAVALLILGTALPATPVLHNLARDGRVVDLEAPETRLLFALPVLALAILGARHSGRLLRRTILVLAVVALVVPLATALVGRGAPRGEQHAPIWLAIEAVAAAGWAALALQAWTQRRFSNGSTPKWITVGLLLMMTAEVLKAWSLTDAHAPHGVAGYVQLLAATVALTAALSSLWTSIRADGANSGDLTRALVDTERRLAQLEEDQQRRLHDARSAVMGVVGASKLLALPDASPAIDPARLQALVCRELDRLQGLLESDEVEPIVEFDLADALSVVVLARRLDGMVIDFDCHDVRVLGRPRATATVLDNLLRNARTHAPRARVSITAGVIGIETEIVVSDNGPGIPIGERVHVLQAGVRGEGARGIGSGLGLYSAARAMAAQSGTLRIGGTFGGGTRITLRMPSSVATPAMAS